MRVVLTATTKRGRFSTFQERLSVRAAHRSQPPPVQSGAAFIAAWGLITGPQLERPIEQAWSMGLNGG
ncbi:hypothetical protein GGE12_002379 [Rhizobium mongolense]|uniref:Uncharacterized protein n=1 Tax=Rhizobium mongolense TaxID=57676 RepID=A0A7W6RLC4_9HYPH|nr:hypothetical protein [Rhizobium mongolense]